MEIYVYKAEIETSLNITNGNCTAEMVGTVSPLTQNNVNTYTSNFSESMGVKIAPSAGGGKGSTTSGSVTLGDLFNWNKSYSHGKSATLNFFYRFSIYRCLLSRGQSPVYVSKNRPSIS
ncbi:MAG: hypothetical protein KBS95_08440 [Alistipes sp.]|nr:hypothetical protein [Candidatus Alistipes equi]